MTTQDHVDLLHAKSFDHTKAEGRYLHIKCSQCQSVTINGIPTHETGCPNARHECKWCNELIPVGQRYCADCQ